MTKKRILIVDDDPQFGNLAKLNLSMRDVFEVEVQSDSGKAIDTAREFKPDLILLDVVMPGLDGGDVQALLRKDPHLADVPVLIVSALVSQEDADDNGIAHSGGTAMLPKTVSPDLMVKCIEEKLAGRL